jgi:hypothetical protein
MTFLRCLSVQKISRTTSSATSCLANFRGILSVLEVYAVFLPSQWRMFFFSPALIHAGKDFSPGTLDRYNTCRDHVRAFIRWKHRIEDIDIKRLNFEFATDLEFWTEGRTKVFSQYDDEIYQHLKKIVNGCIRKGWLTLDGVPMNFSAPLAEPKNIHL